jgi:ribonuclease HI
LSAADLARLVERLRAELDAAGFRATPSSRSAYGQNLAVSRGGGGSYGTLSAYSGKKGPRVVTSGLSCSLTDLAAIEAASARAIVAVGGAPALSGITRGGQPDADETAPAVQAWVDGSYIQQGSRAAAGWGLVVQREGVTILETGGSDIPREAYKHRNIAGEVVAVLRLLEWCEREGVTDVVIHYDYAGLSSWATGAWQARTEFTIGYREAVRRSPVRARWRKVLAHSGEPCNERADQLAGEAAMAKLSCGG